MTNLTKEMKSIVVFFCILSAICILVLKLLFRLIEKHAVYFIKYKKPVFGIYCLVISISVWILAEVIVDLQKSIPSSLEQISNYIPIAAYMLALVPFILVSYRIYKLRYNKSDL